MLLCGSCCDWLCRCRHERPISLLRILLLLLLLLLLTVPALATRLLRACF